FIHQSSTLLPRHRFKCANQEAQNMDEKERLELIRKRLEQLKVEIAKLNGIVENLRREIENHGSVQNGDSRRSQSPQSVRRPRTSRSPPAYSFNLRVSISQSDSSDCEMTLASVRTGMKFVS